MHPTITVTLVEHVIDIGANYGVYALSMARAVGPAGRVWAFEPASGTASLLAAGIDSVQPREALGDWIAAATLEEFERAGSYSSFYTGMAAQRRLEIIRKMGYGSAEMQRRLSLLQRRFGLPAS